ncbi:uncharacterized protein LOC115884842 [Sitophilus oryzae]|uniref:Uncharacterized protein LOC115884842 n=1 Tax=Sitophilus oryzae TaxID=7048 RepID=A0A6J2Y870_SITOR|nr:uncharacterized protein LOC115884842 [Sitophilus oryzae]
MKLVLFFLSFLAVVSLSFTALAHYPKKPGTPGHCFADITGPLNNGQTVQVKNQCAEASCGGDGTLTLVTCGAVAGPKGVSKPDLRKSYPNCCPQPL